MVTSKKNRLSCAANFLRGRKCVFCGSFKVSRTRRGYVKCARRKKQKSMKQLRREAAIITAFYQLQPAYRAANDLGINYQTVTRVYHRLKEREEGAPPVKALCLDCWSGMAGYIQEWLNR